jgi:hypothetical protein
VNRSNQKKIAKKEGRRKKLNSELRYLSIRKLIDQKKNYKIKFRYLAKELRSMYLFSIRNYNITILPEQKFLKK